jgi:hypothetical protein
LWNQHIWHISLISLTKNIKKSQPNIF